MKCRINYNESGEVQSVNTPQGTRSRLFDQLAQTLGTDKALNVYALTETEDFKATQSTKRATLMEGNRKRLKNLLSSLSPKNDGMVTLVVDGNDVPVNLSAMNFKVVDTKGMRTYIATINANGNDVVLGKVRLKPYKDSFKADQILLGAIQTRDAEGNVTDGKGLGIGTQILKRAISETVGSTNKMFFSTGRTEGSAGLMRKFSQAGIAIREGDMELVSVEPQMEEPSMKEVMTFATKRFVRLSTPDKVDIMNTMVGVGFTHSSQLRTALERGLMKNGVLVFTETNLRRTGIYNQFEINNILGDVSYQESIRRMYAGLKDANISADFANPLFVVPTARVNSLGKQSILNPYTVEDEVARIVAGKDLEISLDDIPYDAIKNKYSIPAFRDELNTMASSYKNLPEMKIDMGEIVPRTQNRVRERLEQTFSFDNKEELFADAMYFMGVESAVWNQSKDSLYTLLGNLKQKAANSGIDFLDIDDKVFIKTQPQMLDLLISFADVLNDPSDITMDAFAEEYSIFFDVSEEPLVRTVLSGREDAIYLNTPQSEFSLFKDFNLIKQGENTYVEVEPVSDLSEAYSVLFDNKDRFPSEIQTIEELREYVSNLVKNYDGDFDANLSELENMIVHKMYFRSPMSFPVSQSTQAEERFTNFSGDFEYHSKQYPSDFYIEYLNARNSGSDMFKNFYSKFDVTEEGIVMLENNPLTLSEIEELIPEGLMQYNLISKHLNLPVRGTVVNNNVDQMQLRRENAINNPTTVPKLQGDFAVISPETIAVRNEVEPLVRTPQGIFEYDYQQGDVAFYNLLPPGDVNYHVYGRYRSKTDSSADLRRFTSMESVPTEFFKAKNYYSKRELEEINKRFFEC